MICAEERFSPSSGPKSIVSFQAGTRASGKSSTLSTRPTRMSIFSKSSKLAVKPRLRLRSGGGRRLADHGGRLRLRRSAARLAGRGSRAARSLSSARVRLAARLVARAAGGAAVVGGAALAALVERDSRPVLLGRGLL